MLTSIKQNLKRLWSDESGQSTTEYILILSVVVMIAMKFKNTIGGSIQKMVGKLNNDIEQSMTDQ